MSGGGVGYPPGLFAEGPCDGDANGDCGVRLWRDLFFPRSQCNSMGVRDSVCFQKDFFFI